MNKDFLMSSLNGSLKCDADVIAGRQIGHGKN